VTSRGQPERGAAGNAFRDLSHELRELFGAWGRDPASWPAGRFGELALRAFELQWRAVPAYRGYCLARGAEPSTVADWRDVPPVPTAAFREVDLAVAPPSGTDLLFRTSGTTRGAGRRGCHRVVDAELYRASLEPTFAHHVLDRPEVDADGPLVLSLVPPFEPRRESSLSWMCDDIVGRFGRPGSRSVAESGEPDWREARELAEACAAERVPVCLLGTTLVVDEWARRLEAEGGSLPLPAGSVLMDTGGAKGRPGIRRGDVLERVGETLGLPADRVVNEFGMTELLSQRYGRGAGDASASPPLLGPPWLRTRVLDPVTLEAVPEGRTGVLCHFDLANAGSAVAVLTEDLGRVRGDALEWMGRSPGAPPRGCSLATAELLGALG
jgi:hypothetical protein